MTIEECEKKLEELRVMLSNPPEGRSTESIILEGKVLRIVLDKKLKRQNLGSK